VSERGGAGDGGSAPSRRPTPHRGLLGSAAARTGKVAMAPVNAAARSQLAAGARHKVEDAVLDFLESPEAEEAVSRLLAGPLPDAIGRSLTESHVVERIVESDSFRRAVEEALEGPAVRAALARQGTSILEETIAALCARLERADDSVESAARRLLRRRPRVAEPPEAGLVSRGAAFAADILLAHLAFLAGVAVVTLAGRLAGGLSTPLADALASVGWVLVVGGYFVFFWSTVGSTPGMTLLRLRVAAGAGGGPPGVVRSVLRFAGLVLSLLLVLVAFLPALFGARRRALHDLLAGTTVVRHGGVPTT
jgi:uncharacterized RDD family membrane protein YckC